MRVALVDYGAGNLTSVRKALLAVGADAEVVTMPGQLDRYEGVVIPGVGNFRSAATLATEWRREIVQAVDSGTPLLGICLGMQLLFDGSEEAPDVPGLRLFGGRCARLRVQRPLKVPHVGWNELMSVRSESLLFGVGEGAHVYFTHSFAAPVTAECAAISVQGERFAAAVQRAHVCGVQFHPEKSGHTGLQILRNFVQMARN